MCLFGERLHTDVLNRREFTASPFFLHFLKDYTKGSKITNLRSIIILKDVTMRWQKWGSKQALQKRKTNLSLMEVFNIALKCRVFRF